MKKCIRNLCVATTVSALLFSAAPSVEAGINWGNIAGDIIGALASGDNNNSSNNSSNGGNGGLLSGLSNQKHAVPNPNNNEKLLLLAIENGDTGTVQSMLDAGIDINGVYKSNVYSDGRYANTPFALALYYNNRDMMQVLLEHGANISGYYDFDNNYINYFVYASKYVQKDLLEYLHNWGADINGTYSGSGINALNRMYGYGYYYDRRIDCARYLLENGINPDNTPKNGSPVLCEAVSHADYKMIDLLANYGANLNARDCHGRSVLEIALANQNLQLYKYLQDIIARGQQPSKYRAVKEAAMAEENANKARKDEVAAFNKNLSKAIYNYNNFIRSFNENTDTLVNGSPKERRAQADKMLITINDTLELIDSNNATLSSCSEEEKEALLTWQDFTKSAILKQKEVIEIFMSEQELTYDDLEKATLLTKEAGDISNEANEKKRVASELLKIKL